MATVLIHAGVASGAMNAILSGRYVTDDAAADYSAEATKALALADAVAAQAASVSLADADLATPNMEILCAQVTAGVLGGRDLSQLAAGSAMNSVALSIAAAVKAGIAAI